MRQLKLEELKRLNVVEARRSPKLPIVLVLENMRSAFNVGSLFRSADSFAIQKIILIGFTPQPPHPEIRKAALGAEDVVEWIQESYINEAPKHYPPNWLSLALEQTDVPCFLEDFDCHSLCGLALYIGNEVHGLSQDALNLCSSAIEIRQFGHKHSLNAAIAGSIALWWLSTCIRRRY